MERINITLEDEEAEKLRRPAERMHVQPGTVARSLLASALDQADPDARNIVELLDAIPGAYERAQLGLDQARQGQTIPLELPKGTPHASRAGAGTGRAGLPRSGGRAGDGFGTVSR